MKNHILNEFVSFSFTNNLTKLFSFGSVLLSVMWSDDRNVICNDRLITVCDYYY